MLYVSSTFDQLYRMKFQGFFVFCDPENGIKKPSRIKQNSIRFGKIQNVGGPKLCQEKI